MTPDDILPTYERLAPAFDRLRDKTLFERSWLDRLLAHAPGRKVLDLGCGSGRPVAQYLFDRRCDVTGIDGAAAMIALFEKNLPKARAIHADMRGLDLGETFDAVLGWDSFFHLAKDDQRAMFPVFAKHLRPRGVLMFTSGTGDGEAIGHVDEATVYHASLAPEEYRKLLQENGLEVLRHVVEDPDCQTRTIWLARLKG